MKYTPIDKLVELQWLRETHDPHLPAETLFVILHGNEDAPSKLEAWFTATPRFDQPANYVWIAPWAEVKDSGT